MTTGILTRYGHALGVAADGTDFTPGDGDGDPGGGAFEPTSSTVTPVPADPGQTVTWTIRGAARTDGTNPSVGAVKDSSGRGWTLKTLTPTEVVFTTTIKA